MPFLCSGLYCLIFDKQDRGESSGPSCWIDLLRPETGDTLAPFCSPARTRSGVCFADWTYLSSPDCSIPAQSTSSELVTLLLVLKILAKLCAQPCATSHLHCSLTFLDGALTMALPYEKGALALAVSSLTGAVQPPSRLQKDRPYTWQIYVGC